MRSIIGFRNDIDDVNKAIFYYLYENIRRIPLLIEYNDGR